ncbi:DNA ligase [Nocardioidaceae bacterium]|nr:DNA ligase [Nocardioidaceae bacterium]
MLATSGTRVPTDPGWAHEVKWDGMRALVDVSGARERRTPRLTTRTERDVTVAFPELGVVDGALAGRDLLLDGEVVAMVEGRPSFAGLADRFHVTDARRAARLAAAAPTTYLAFDLLRLDGEDLIGRPWAERRRMLDDIAATALDDGGWPRLSVPPVYDDGEVLHTATAAQGLEGVVSKRVTSPYRPGRRSEEWLKFPHRPTRSYVVGGWRPEKDGRGLGAVLVGEPSTAGLVYRGRVGSGLAGAAGRRLLDLLLPLTTHEVPFATEVPPTDGDVATWVRPEVVVDIASLGLTGGGRLRQPSHQRVRPDLTPDDVMGA